MWLVVSKIYARRLLNNSIWPSTNNIKDMRKLTPHFSIFFFILCISLGSLSFSHSLPIYLSIAFHHSPSILFVIASCYCWWCGADVVYLRRACVMNTLNNTTSSRLSSQRWSSVSDVVVHLVISLAAEWTERDSKSEREREYGVVWL